jgi:5-bromo-4-chloroindolyl phosphate hydrolysis protein
MSKKDRIEQYLKDNVGNIITARNVAGNCNCTVQTVYNYIKANPHKFNKFDHGKFIYRDVTSVNTAVEPTVEVEQKVMLHQHDW